MSCTKSEIWSLLYYCLFLCVLLLTLCFFCVVCSLLYLSVNSHYYKTCHGTFISQIHVFSFDVILVIFNGFCLMLSSCVCVLHFNVVSSFSSYIKWVLPRIWFVTPILSFEHRNTTVAFIFHIVFTFNLILLRFIYVSAF